MRYLELPYIRSALNRGKAVAQWLPPRPAAEHTMLSWVMLEPCLDAGSEGVALRFCAVFDEPALGTYDVMGFSAVDPNAPDGVVEPYATLEEALDASQLKYGAQRDRYLNPSMLDSEYEAYRSAI